MAFIRSAQTGNYSDPATWDGGVVPTTGDVACAGETHRITLDIDPLAELSTSSVDHISAGGAALPTTSTGGFTVPDGATRAILKYRYDMIRSAGVTTSTAPLGITNGTISIDEVALAGNVTVFTNKTILLSPTGILNLTVGTITLTPTHNTSSTWHLFELANSASANITLTFGDVIPASGTSIGCALIRTNATAPTSLNITFTGQIYSRTTNGHTIELTPTGSWPIGRASFTALSNQIGVGSGTGGCINLRYFKTVEFADLSLLKDSMNSANNIIYLSDILTSIIIDSDITLPALGTLSFSGPAAITVNGTISRVATSATNPVTSIALQSVSGDIVINGDILSDGVLLTSNGSPPIINITGNVAGTFTVNNLIVTGFGRPCISMSAGTKQLNILGDVDVSAGVITTVSSTGIGSAIFISSSAFPSITIAGDVKAADSPASTAVAPNNSSTICAAIVIVSSNGVSNLTINGTTYAGRSTPAICTDCIVDFPIKIKKVVSGANLLSTTRAPPAVQTVIQTVEVDEMDFGPEGRFPVNGYVKVRTAAAGIFTVPNMDDSPCVLVESGDGLATIASNVRSGVSIGSTVGTLIVPDAGNVLQGITYDNGTVGTLVTTENVVVDFSSVQTAIDAVKAKTDQLTFGTTGIIIDENTGSTPQNVLDGLAQLDELSTIIDSIASKTTPLTIATAVAGKKVNIV